MRTLAWSLILGSALVASEARADVVWLADFEEGDLAQWSFVLNGEVGDNTYAFAQGEIVAEGSFAGRLELHDDAEWPNGLKRVELQHRPTDERTAEGATTYFAWSFYLPEALPEDPTQQIGYWESANSFQQMMAFQVAGQGITFSTRQPMNVVQWQADGVVTPGEWHRIAMGVTWSTDPGMGAVDVWFDGQQVVDGASAQTLADDNPHFVQVGLLRGAITFEDVPVIIIDDAAEGDTLDDVRPDDLPGQGGETGSSDGGMSSTGPGDDTTGTPGDDTTGDGGGSSGGVSSGGMGSSGGTGEGSGSGAADGGDESGCGCRSGSSGFGAWGLLALLGFGLRRRRRAA